MLLARTGLKGYLAVTGCSVHAEKYIFMTEITGKPRAKFGADPKETVAGYWEQINTRTLSYYI